MSGIVLPLLYSSKQSSKLVAQPTWVMGLIVSLYIVMCMESQMSCAIEYMISMEGTTSRVGAVAVDFSVMNRNGTQYMLQIRRNLHRRQTTRKGTGMKSVQPIMRALSYFQSYASWIIPLVHYTSRGPPLDRLRLPFQPLHRAFVPSFEIGLRLV